MNHSIRVLHLEDDPHDAELIQQKLKAEGLSFEIVRVDRKETFESALERGAYDLVLTDYNLPDYDGMSALKRVRERQPDLPVIVISGTLGEEDAVECLKAGATDYVLKDRLQRLGAAVRAALDRSRLKREAREAEKGLRESEERFRAAFEQAGVGMALRSVDPRNPRWLRVNQKMCDILGYTREELLQLTSLDITPPEERGVAIDYNEQLLCGEITSYSRDKRYVRKNGQVIWANISLSAVRGPDGQPTHVISVIQDVTGRKEADEKIRRLNRVHAVLSGINTLIVRVRDRQELFNEACRIAVEHGNFGLAWISEFDPATLDVTPVAWAGIGADDYVSRSKSTARADIARGQGVVGRAIREKKPAICDDIAAEPDVGSPKRKEAIRRGYHSVIALPLFLAGTVWGTLTMYAKEPDYFNEEELKLLNELADDISFAIENIARNEKLEKLSRIRAVSGELNAAIVRIHDREALLRETSRIATEHGNFGMVWIASIDAAKQEVRPVAWTGFSPEAAHAVSWASMGAVRGTLGEVIRTRKVAVRNDLDTEMRAGILRQEAMKKGYRSMVCVPFMVDDNVVAAMNLFTPGVGFFDDEELALLNEVAADVSFALQSIAKQEKVEYLSYYDVLTGLPNRTLFVDRLSQQMRSRSGEQQMVALIVIDIERFRNINESLGYRGGDELLNSIAHRLEHTFHGKDYLARISSNGFGAIVRGMKDAADIVHVVEDEVFACFMQPFMVSDRELRVSVKAGVAMFPADGADADTLFRNAESALKRAQASSDRYLFYAADMNAQAAHAMALETRLRKAVEAQQFVLHYQPKIDLATGRICGLEALIRWQDPESGLVAPGTFIPLLEETGLILEVGRWVLGQALADYRDWTACGCTVPRIAINVSAIQLQQKDFTDIVISVVQQAGGLSRALELEITESLIMKDIKASIAKLALLRESGIHIAMDDFGTGYSSLSYIARLPINTVKIDRSFVSAMAAGADALSIVTTMIGLAHSLNLRVVAEGVETEEQAQMLRLLRCDEAQGYLFSKPLPAPELVAFLQKPALAPQASRE